MFKLLNNKEAFLLGFFDVKIYPNFLKAYLGDYTHAFFKQSSSFALCFVEKGAFQVHQKNRHVKNQDCRKQLLRLYAVLRENEKVQFELH